MVKYTPVVSASAAPAPTIQVVNNHGSVHIENNNVLNGVNTPVVVDHKQQVPNKCVMKTCYTGLCRDEKTFVTTIVQLYEKQ